jgi:pimeloyl-ACP methyl ester carboxylesterase
MATIEYLEAGRGPALLLIHGFPLSGKTWAAQLDALLPSCRVIVPDLRGFGRSATSADQAASMDDYAADLLELMDRLRVDRFTAAGHSMGGYVLFALQRLAPARLAAAALVCTRALPDSQEAKGNRELTAARVEKEGVGFLADAQPAKLIGPENPALKETIREIIAATPAATVAAASRAIGRRPDASPLLPQLRIPVTALIGRKDQLIPPAESEAMAKAIPGAQIVWGEKSGHLMMMEEPELVNRALADLVAKAAT